MSQSIKTETYRVRAVETKKDRPTLADLRALVEACEGMSDRAHLTVTGTAKSAVYVGEAAITGRLIVRDTTTEKE